MISELKIPETGFQVGTNIYQLTLQRRNLAGTRQGMKVHSSHYKAHGYDAPAICLLI